jgi:CheY-like chemotaxis protein
MLADPPQQRLAGLNVLVVDDDPGIRSLLGMTLASDGANVHMAEHGQAALELVRKTDACHLIVLDLQMPVMDGRTFFRALRALPCATPVLIMSALGAEKARQELGAEAAIDKPFDPFILAERVKELITDETAPGDS